MGSTKQQMKFGLKSIIGNLILVEICRLKWFFHIQPTDSTIQEYSDSAQQTSK